MSDDGEQTRESDETPEESYESRSTDLISRGSSGIVPKSLPLLTYELSDADHYEDWRKALEAYSLANNSWRLIFEPHEKSLNHMIKKYSNYRTSEDIRLAHDEWCGKLFGVMYQSVMKLTGDVLLGELRSMQSSRATDILADPHHLLQYISNRYEKLSCFSRANEFMEVFSMTYSSNQNPAELRERLLTKIIRFENGKNVISEDIKMTIIYNTIPSSIQPLIRGYIPHKANVTFDDVYHALKIMYDEKKSKQQKENEEEEDEELSREEKKMLALLRNSHGTKRKRHCWYCNEEGHVKFTCPKVNEDKKKGINVKINPYKPEENQEEENIQSLSEDSDNNNDEDSEATNINDENEKQNLISRKRKRNDSHEDYHEDDNQENDE